MISVLGAVFSVIGAGLAVMTVQFIMEMLKISHIPATLALPLGGSHRPIIDPLLLPSHTPLFPQLAIFTIPELPW